MNEEIKNVTEETMVEEAVEMVEKKTNFLTKVGSGVKKHGKKIAVAGAAVIGVGLLVAKAVLKKNDGNDYETDYDTEFDGNDEIESVVEETIE